MFFVGVSLLKKNIQSFVQFKFLYLLDGTVIPMAIADVAVPPFRLGLQGYLTSLGLLTLPQRWEPSRALEHAP